jgi:hypothetical protein
VSRIEDFWFRILIKIEFVYFREPARNVSEKRNNIFFLLVIHPKALRRWWCCYTKKNIFFFIAIKLSIASRLFWCFFFIIKIFYILWLSREYVSQISILFFSQNNMMKQNKNVRTKRNTRESEMRHWENEKKVHKNAWEHSPYQYEFSCIGQEWLLLHLFFSHSVIRIVFFIRSLSHFAIPLLTSKKWV